MVFLYRSVFYIYQFWTPLRTRQYPGHLIFLLPSDTIPIGGPSFFKKFWYGDILYFSLSRLFSSIAGQDADKTVLRTT